MISFIVIGRNEGWKITKCLESVFATIKQNELTEFEVIYIDSNSDDDSINRVQSFEKVNIFILTGKYNAAIARNAGANKSKGDVLFFIDGDMEIQPKFLALVYQEGNGITYPFLSGQFTNLFYKNKDLIYKKNHYSSRKNIVKQAYTGGIFIILRKLWYEVGGMKNYMKVSEDVELALRISNKGFLQNRYPEIIALHNTINQLEKEKLYNYIFGGNEFYRAVLIRGKLFNKFMWKMFVREDYTSIILIFSTFGFIIFYNLYFPIFYLSIVLCRVLVNKKFNSNKFFLILYYILRDFGFWISFFCFWPSIRKQKISCERI